MSKIGSAVLEAQERTGKTVDELTNEDISPAARARNHVNSGMEADPAFQLGWIMYDLESRADDLNVFSGDLTAVKDEIDTVIAKLTKVAEKLQ